MAPSRLPARASCRSSSVSAALRASLSLAVLMVSIVQAQVVGEPGGIDAIGLLGDATRPVRLMSPPALAALPVVSSARLVFFEVSPDYKAVKHHLREAARQHGVDYALLQAVIATESRFDAAAVSPRGAVGLMQLMPATAARFLLASDPRVPLQRQLADPRANIQAGARYLRYLIDLHPGRLDLALAAYNAGEGAVQRAGNQIPPIAETQNYVNKVMTLYNGLRSLSTPRTEAWVGESSMPVPPPARALSVPPSSIPAASVRVPGLAEPTDRTMISSQR